MALTDNLIAHWKLDEASGTRNDSHGTNHLTDNNTVTQAAGQIGNAALFTEANSESLSVADNADLSMGAGVRFTIAAWVYPISLGGGIDHNIVAKRTGLGNLEYYLRAKATGFSLEVSPDGNTPVTRVDASTFGAPATNTWHFVVAWYDGVNLNISVNNGAANTAAFSADVFNGTSALRIGGSDAGTEYLDGRIDSVSLWKRALTTQERTDLWNGGAGLDYPFTVAGASSTGLFPTDFRADLRERFPEVYLSLQLGAPFNMVVGSTGFSSDSRGNVDGRILQWGTMRRAVDLLTHVLADPWEVNPEYTDADLDPAKRRQFQRLWAKYRSTGRRAEATLRAHTRHSTWTVAKGLLRDAPLNRPFVFTLSIRPDDGPLRNGKVPKLPISAYFPSAHDDVKGSFAPVLYGVFNSNGAGNQGFVPLYQVDQTAKRWLLGQGPCGGVDSVYDKDGHPLPTSQWTFSRVVINGALFSIVTISSTVADDLLAPVLYADASGLTVNPDGTGGVITNPADQILHASRNFIWGDYRSGVYLTTAPVNEDAITVEAAYFTAMGEEGSYWYGGDTQQTGLDVVNDYLESTGSYGFWSNDGEVIFKVLDHRPPSTIYPETWVEGNTEELGAFGAPSDASVIEKGVTVSYTRDPARGDYKNTLRVVNKAVQEDVIGTLELPWSASRVV